MISKYVAEPTAPPPNPSSRPLPPADQIAALEVALHLVREECLRAMAKFQPFNSSHEGYAVILEELDELWDEVKGNRPDLARKEAVQVAAMAVRFLLDVD